MCFETSFLLPAMCLLVCLLPMVGCLALSSASSSSPSPQRPRMDPISAVGHVGAVVSASAELYEDLEVASSIGHSHGLLLLCGSRVCRELNVMREAFAGEAEDLDESTRLGATRLRKPLSALIRLLTCTTVSMMLALGGLTAALVEVLRDARPGGHHGAIFLATNELCELLEESKVAKGRLLRVVENRRLRLFLLLNATIFAAIETIRDFSPKLGAHQGVLWLAISQTLRCVGMLRSEYKEKEA